jgi:pyridoxal 5'-phosphate synthase pdxT subunit
MNFRLKIGILAIHGSVSEHAKILQKLNLIPVEIRAPQDFKNIQGLILPGGESTMLSDLIEKYNLKKSLIQFANNLQNPIFGTCAGLILLAKFGLLNIQVQRNAYGRQINSFETELKIPTINTKKFLGIFIRAPKILHVSPKVEILSHFENSPVFVRQNNIFAATFHPELTNDMRIHKFIFSQ